MADVTIDANPVASISAIVQTVSGILDKVLPDKQANDAAKAQLLLAQVNGDIQASIAQTGVDTSEAANKSVFVAGWRPFVGWVCGCAFAYAFIVQPLAQSVAVLCHLKFDPTLMPKLDIATMMPVMLGMLGLGAMRSFDKTQGTGNGN